MLILTIRTDKPTAELGLFEGETQIAYESWEAHRQLAETIHIKIRELLETHNKQLVELRGIVAFKGPGSFTGLRIGLTVANALVDSLSAVIVATGGDDWLKSGIARLEKGDSDTIALPDYGADPHITQQKK